MKSKSSFKNLGDCKIAIEIDLVIVEVQWLRLLILIVEAVWVRQVVSITLDCFQI